jgi:hypothetical protein
MVFMLVSPSRGRQDYCRYFHNNRKGPVIACTVMNTVKRMRKVMNILLAIPDAMSRVVAGFLRKRDWRSACIQAII